MKVAAFNYDQGAEKTKRLAKEFREELHSLVTSKQKEDVDICAANTAAVNLQAALSNVDIERAQQRESIEALSAMVQGPTTSQAKRKAVDEESPAPEAARGRGSDMGRGHRKKISRNGNAFLSSAFTPSRTVQE